MGVASILLKERGRTEWMTSSQLGKRSAKGTIVIASGSWIRFILQFASTILLARLLGPEEYGAAAVVLAVAAASALVRESGLFTLAVNRERLGSRLATSMHFASIMLGVVGALFMAGSGPALASLFQDDRYVSFALLLSPSFVFAGISAVPAAILTRNLFSERLASLEILATVISVAGGVGLAIAGWGAHAMVMQTLLLGLAQTAFTILFCPWAPDKGWSWRAVKVAFPAATSLTAVQVLNYATANLDKLIVGATFGVKAAGYYSQAIQLLQIPLQLVGGPMQRVFLPTLSRIVRDSDRYRNYVRAVILVMAGMLWPFFAVLAIFSEHIVYAVFGAEWMNAAPLFIVLAISGYAQSIGFVVSWIMVSRGLYGDQIRLSVASKAIIIGAYVIGAQTSAIGVATGLSISTVLLVFPAFWLAKRKSKVQWTDLGSPLLWPAVICAASLYIGVSVNHLVPDDAQVLTLVLKLAITIFGTLIVALAIVPVRVQLVRILNLVLSK